MHTRRAETAAAVYWELAELCLKGKEFRNVIVEFDAVSGDTESIRTAMERLGKPRKIRGLELDWLDFTIACVFPFDLYWKHGADLQAMLDDPELGDFRLGVRGDLNFSYVGRLEHWNSWNGAPYRQLSYVLRRMREWPGTKTFMCYTSTPDWLYAGIDTNMKQPKTGRTNWACLSAVDFKRDVDGTLTVSAFARNMYLTHAAGDYIGLALLNRAVAESVGLKPGRVVVHSTNLSNDAPKWNRSLLDEQHDTAEPRSER